MFGIGTGELIVIFIIAIIVLGPKEIPKIARTLGRGMREIQRAKDELKKNIEFEDESFDDIKSELDKTNEEIESADNDQKGIKSGS